MLLLLCCVVFWFGFALLVKWRKEASAPICALTCFQANIILKQERQCNMLLHYLYWNATLLGRKGQRGPINAAASNSVRNLGPIQQINYSAQQR